MTTADELPALCQRGRCFEVSAGEARAVYVVSVRNGVAWVDACKGSGSADLTAAVDEALTRQAQGLAAIAFQTKRPGLVRKLQARGYTVTGWVMTKGVQ